jgi:hypothetical protein
MALIAALGAITFNPFMPLHMDREQWAVLNVIFAAGFGLAGLRMHPAPARQT